MKKKPRRQPVGLLKFLQGGRMAVFAIACLALPVASIAQSTSSTARGTITGPDGTPIANATVTITHVSSGTVEITTTGENGYYYEPGLRVGGPYTVGVTAGGYRATLIDEIYFSPGVQTPLNISLEAAAEAIEEIIVSAKPIPVRDLNNGVGSAFTAQDIGNTPAQQRDVIRTMLRDPLAQSSEEGNLSVAGSNPRFNGFAIDGSLQTDDMGLNDNNPEDEYSTYATVRSPINLDAVESATLVASDYDVGTSGFTGGLVTLTTKSGTNEWDGSVFYYWQDDDMFGEDYDGGKDYDPGPIDETEYGITLGGPIIKDKLFFFASYDEFESASSVDFLSSDQNNGIEPGFFEALRGVVQGALNGFDPGTRPQSASTPELSERTLLKLDWNISDDHRAAFTYQKTEELGSSVSATSFDSTWYEVPVELEAYTFQLFSDWNDNLSTTIRYNFKDFARGQNCRGGSDTAHYEFENLDMDDLVGTPLEGLVTTNSTPDIIAGCDRFRHANEYNDERTQILARADYFTGDHVISAGIEYEQFDLFNLFISGGANGRFQYDNYDDLINMIADVNYQNVSSNVKSEAAASWGYDKWALFLQDSVQITPDLEIGFGLRYEKISQSDKPAFDQSILDTYGVDTTNNLDGKDILLPRVSFRWNATDRATLTGGFGLYAGGDPKVWTSNAFQLPTVFVDNFDLGDFGGYVTDGSTVPQPLLDYVSDNPPVLIDYISEHFRIPSDWKASLRLEQDLDLGFLGEDYSFTAQYLYTRTKNGFLWTNLAQTALSTGVAPDGRPIYADLEDLGIPNLTELGNHNDGTSHVVALGLAKRFDNGFDFNINYAHQDVETATPGSSSRGISNWRAIFGTDRNNPVAKTSIYEIEHSIKLNLGYEKDFFGSGESMSRLDLFARRFSGDVLSFTFDVDEDDPSTLFGRAGQGEDPFDNDTLYVPTGPSDPAVVYASGFDQEAFEAYVARNVPGRGLLEPNNGRSGYVTMVDLRFQQNVPGLPFLGNSLGDNNFKVVLDIENFLNLLNSDWGRWDDGWRFRSIDLVEADMVLASDVAANGVDGATALQGDNVRQSCQTQSDCQYRFRRFNNRSINNINRFKSVYKIRLGIRFDF